MQSSCGYTNINGGVSITKYFGAGGSVIVPDFIDGLPVTCIATNAFRGNVIITGIKIPNCLTNIGAYSFFGCSNLAYAELGTNLVTIGNNAFEYCSNLKTINLPNGLKSIGPLAFELSGLTTITIPSTYANIEPSAFGLCQELTNVIILNGVNSIGKSAFSNCRSLNNVVIPASVTNIGNNAFSYCNSLTNLFFAGNAPSIGWGILYAVTNPIAYYLPGTTGWTTFAAQSGASTVLWNPTIPIHDPSFGVHNNQFGFNLTGTPNIPIVVEACTNLANPQWTSLLTCNVTNGSIYFSDPMWTNFPTRIYRIRSP
jgi:hypothetical protein